MYLRSIKFNNSCGCDKTVFISSCNCYCNTCEIEKIDKCIYAVVRLKELN